MPAVFGFLSKELGLKGEDVVEHPVDAAALEAVLGENPRSLEVFAKRGTERSVDALLTAHLGLLQQLQAAV